MSRRRRGARSIQPETVTLAEACRRIGISLPTAGKIIVNTPADFPKVFWIGGRRYLLRRQLDQWLAAKGG